VEAAEGGTGILTFYDGMGGGGGGGGLIFPLTGLGENWRGGGGFLGGGWVGVDLGRGGWGWVFGVLGVWGGGGGGGGGG